MIQFTGSRTQQDCGTRIISGSVAYVQNLKPQKKMNLSDRQ